MKHLLIVLAAFVGLNGCLGDESSLPPTPMKELSTVSVKTFKVATPHNDDSIYIPLGSLTQRGGANMVFEIRDSKARLRTVRTGKTKAKDIQILSGLQGNEILVSDNLDALFDGSPVQTRHSN